MTGLDWNVVVLSLTGAAWQTGLAWAGVMAVRRWIAPEIRDWSSRDAAVLAGLALLFVVGIGWGWPGPGWPPDEIQPDMLREALARRFSGGWFDKYPPGFYYLLTLVSAPVLIAGPWIALSAGEPAVEAIMQMQGRGVSLIAAVALVAGVMVLAERWLGPSYRRAAAVACACSMPLAFYARTANVEAAYLGFSVWALVALSGWYRGRRRDLVAAAILASLAIGTKDQAAGLFILPAIAMVMRSRRDPAAVGVAVLAAAAVLFLLFNVAFNVSGVISHVREVLGPASADYREYGIAPAEQAALALEVGRQFAGMLGWWGLAALAIGLGVLRRAHVPLWVWLPCVSYYAFFLAAAGYTYDRFLLPLLPAAALVMAAGVRRLLDGLAGRRLGPALAVVILAGLVARVVWLDAATVFDARYAAERWLRQSLEPGAVVATDAPPTHTPRLAGLAQTAIRPGVADTERVRPDAIVVNTSYVQRYAGDPVREAWLAWIGSADGPYVEAFRYQARPPRALAWLRPFVAPAFDDPYTNLNKINPEIVIYRRIRD